MIAPSILVLVISQLENLTTQEEYTQAIAKLKSLVKTIPELSTIININQVRDFKVQAKELANLLRNYAESKDDSTAKIESTLSQLLDIESVKNIKKELRKTYMDNNIFYIAKGSL